MKFFVQYSNPGESTCVTNANGCASMLSGIAIIFIDENCAPACNTLTRAVAISTSLGAPSTLQEMLGLISVKEKNPTYMLNMWSGSVYNIRVASPDVDPKVI